VKRDPVECLDDMIEYARKARAFVGDLDFAAFQADEKTRFAAIRALEVVGEAARGIPPDLRTRAPDVPWPRIVGMRNFLAHDYMGTNPQVVYDTVRLFLPDLIDRLMALRAAIGASDPQRRA
jgi:uncharacterized protein with HEPN domain